MTEVEKAKQVIEQETKEKVKRCQDRIEKVLTEEGCVLEAQVLLTGSGVLPRVVVKPNT